MSPVSRAARLGAQLGDATNMCVNVTPALASRAMFGVRTSAAPYTEESRYPWSSERKTTRFGLARGLGFSSATAGVAPRAHTDSQANRKRDGFMTTRRPRFVVGGCGSHPPSGG